MIMVSVAEVNVPPPPGRGAPLPPEGVAGDPQRINEFLNLPTATESAQRTIIRPKERLKKRFQAVFNPSTASQSAESATIEEVVDSDATALELSNDGKEFEDSDWPIPRSQRGRNAGSEPRLLENQKTFERTIKRNLLGLFETGQSLQAFLKAFFEVSVPSKQNTFDFLLEGVTKDTNALSEVIPSKQRKFWLAMLEFLQLSENGKDFLSSHTGGQGGQESPTVAALLVAISRVGKFELTQFQDELKKYKAARLVAGEILKQESHSPFTKPQLHQFLFSHLSQKTQRIQEQPDTKLSNYQIFLRALEAVSSGDDTLEKLAELPIGDFAEDVQSAALQLAEIIIEKYEQINQEEDARIAEYEWIEQMQKAAAEAALQAEIERIKTTVEEFLNINTPVFVEDLENDLDETIDWGLVYAEWKTGQIDAEHPLVKSLIHFLDSMSEVCHYLSSKEGLASNEQIHFWSRYVGTKNQPAWNEFEDFFADSEYQPYVQRLSAVGVEIERLITQENPDDDFSLTSQEVIASHVNEFARVQFLVQKLNAEMGAKIDQVLNRLQQEGRTANERSSFSDSEVITQLTTWLVGLQFMASGKRFTRASIDWLTQPTRSDSPLLKFFKKYLAFLSEDEDESEAVSNLIQTFELTEENKDQFVKFLDQEMIRKVDLAYGFSPDQIDFLSGESMPEIVYKIIGILFPDEVRDLTVKMERSRGISDAPSFDDFRLFLHSIPLATAEHRLELSDWLQSQMRRRYPEEPIDSDGEMPSDHFDWLIQLRMMFAVRNQGVKKKGKERNMSAAAEHNFLHNQLPNDPDSYQWIQTDKSVGVPEIETLSDQLESLTAKLEQNLELLEKAIEAESAAESESDTAEDDSEKVREAATKILNEMRSLYWQWFSLLELQRIESSNELEEISLETTEVAFSSEPKRLMFSWFTRRDSRLTNATKLVKQVRKLSDFFTQRAEAVLATKEAKRAFVNVFFSELPSGFPNLTDAQKNELLQRLEPLGIPFTEEIKKYSVGKVKSAVQRLTFFRSKLVQHVETLDTFQNKSTSKLIAQLSEVERSKSSVEERLRYLFDLVQEEGIISDLEDYKDELKQRRNHEVYVLQKKCISIDVGTFPLPSLDQGESKVALFIQLIEEVDELIEKLDFFQKLKTTDQDLTPAQLAYSVLELNNVEAATHTFFEGVKPPEKKEPKKSRRARGTESSAASPLPADELTNWAVKRYISFLESGKAA